MKLDTYVSANQQIGMTGMKTGTTFSPPLPPPHFRMLTMAGEHKFSAKLVVGGSVFSLPNLPYRVPEDEIRSSCSAFNKLITIRGNSLSLMLAEGIHGFMNAHLPTPVVVEMTSHNCHVTWLRVIRIQAKY